MPTQINPATFINAEPLNLQDLLGDNEFTIPDYQRDFAWKKSQVRQLWNDLISHYNKNTNDDELILNPEAYFLGAIVLIFDKENNKHYVIDGQQRLTTLTSISSVLLDFFSTIEDIALKDGITSSLRPMIGKFTGSEWKLKVNLYDSKLNEFLLNSCVIHYSRHDRTKYWCNSDLACELLTIKNHPANRIKTSIECSYEEMDRFLSEAVSPQDKIKKLHSLYRILSECFIVLRIEAGSPSTAYELFEALNFRGLPLNQADLVKNELIKAASAITRSDVVDYWRYMRNSLDSHETISLPDLLHYSYISRYEYIKAGSLFKSVKDKLSDIKPNEFATRLGEDSEYLEKLVKGDSTKWNQSTLNMLRDIKEVLNIKLIYPALITGCDKIGDQKSLFESYTRLIMNFGFRFMKVMDGDVGQLAIIISNVCEMVRSEKDLDDIANYLYSFVRDDAFKEQFKSIGFNNTKLCYYIVYYLELYLLSGTSPIHHGMEQNLEHIMPRTPSKSDWPGIYKEKKNNNDIFREYVWRVGNLLALPENINKSIKNKGISYKISNTSKKDYNNCDLRLPKDVINFLDTSEWTYRSIDLRQIALAENYAVGAWKIK